MESVEKIQSIRKSMDNQEERLQQHNLQDLRQQYEQVSMRETQLNKLLSEEKTRNRIQKLEIDRRQQQLEDSNVMIQTLQEELESVYKKSRSLSMELQYSELKARNDSDILNMKTKISELDAIRKRKQIELDAANDANLSAEKNLDSSRREIEQLRAALAAKEVEIAHIRRPSMVFDEDSLCRDRNSLDRINQEIGSLETGNNNVESLDRINQEIGDLETENNAVNNRNDQLRKENQNLEKKRTRSEYKKRPIITMVNLKSNEPPHKSRQVPINILASTKPWRPTATVCKPSSSQKMAIAPIAKFKKKNDARNLEDHLQKTTTTNCNMPRQILIGAPMFTSTPAKKRQFPAFQL